jgi:hypothetical protein
MISLRKNAARVPASEPTAVQRRDSANIATGQIRESFADTFFVPLRPLVSAPARGKAQRRVCPTYGTVTARI